MMGKFALCFLVAFCAVQGYQARNVEAKPLDIIDDVVNQLKATVSWISQQLQKAIEQIQDITKNLSDIIKNIEAEIQKQIDNIASQVKADEEVIRKCTAPVPDQLNELEQKLQGIVNECNTAMKPIIDKMTGDVEQIEEKVNSFTDEVSKKVGECKLNPGCIVDVVRNEIPKARELIQQCVSIGQDIAGEVPNAVSQAHECGQKIVQEGSRGAADIISQLRKCFEDNTQ